MIQVSDAEVLNVKKLIEGRRVDIVVQGALNDIYFKFERSPHIDAHDKANLTATLRMALELLILDGNGQEVFGQKLEDTDPDVLRVVVMGLTKFVKVGGRI
jgi:hypothetical protein